MINHNNRQKNNTHIFFFFDKQIQKQTESFKLTDATTHNNYTNTHKIYFIKIIIVETIFIVLLVSFRRFCFVT